MLGIRRLVRIIACIYLEVRAVHTGESCGVWQEIWESWHIDVFPCKQGVWYG